MSNSFIFKKSNDMQCTYIKHDGSQCHGNTIEGSEFCWFHCPKVDYHRSWAQSKGGKAHRTGIYSELPVINLKTINDVPELLIDTIRQLRHGFIGPRIAATLGYLSGMLLKSYEIFEVDTRLRKTEKFVKDSLIAFNCKLEEFENKKKWRD